jgi:hypothetical protein
MKVDQPTLPASVSLGSEQAAVTGGITPTPPSEQGGAILQKATRAQLGRLPLLASKPAAEAAPQRPADRFDRIFVIDSDDPGVSVNPGDKRPDLSHGQSVARLVDAIYNTWRKPGDARRTPIDLILRVGQRGIGWAVWNFSGKFGICDDANRAWRTALPDALTGR